MNGYEIINVYLTENEKEKLLINLINVPWRSSCGVEYDYHNPWDLIDEFVWSQSPEGYDYWKGIEERIIRNVIIKPFYFSKQIKQHVMLDVEF